eukprot:TRINITY_DN5135_c0_g2_i1.p1 TRINITY_DN5135_c0_g2~~TRINITY_DN5135_c0_g2_i1.p1  ORF type:complete len:178 (-),score=48.74 TRINITY_DN5135_c0_g2_i1:16-549(-)
MWKYVEFGVQQKVKLPSFDTMLYLCDPAKVIGKKEASSRADSAVRLTVPEMMQSGHYKDLVRLLLVDKKASKEFDSYLSELGIKFPKYPGFMTTENKLAEMEVIVKEAEELRKEVEVPEVKDEKEQPQELDINDIELCYTFVVIWWCWGFGVLGLSLIHICRCRRIERCRSRWSPYH